MLNCVTKNHSKHALYSSCSTDITISIQNVFLAEQGLVILTFLRLLFTVKLLSAFILHCNFCE